MVFATAVRLLGRRPEAEDVAQTIFLRAFQRFDELSRSATAGGWLKTATRNECLNYLGRYRSRWRFFSELTAVSDHDSSSSFEDTLIEQRLPSTNLEIAERDRRVEEALQELPDHQRVPLVLFHFEEMSYQQIADLVGASLGKVKTDIHRGREKLRRLLADEDLAAR